MFITHNLNGMTVSLSRQLALRTMELLQKADTFPVIDTQYAAFHRAQGSLP